MDLKEKTIASEVIFSGRVIKLRVDQVRLPNGKTSTREIIDHPGAVAIVALDEQHQVWLVRQYRKAVNRALLEIPAGTLDKDEEPLACARRELEEETGLKARQWQEILSYYSAPGFCNEKLHLFLAQDLYSGKACPDHDEFVEPVKMPLKEAYEAVLNNLIMDGKSIIGLQYAYFRIYHEI
ncbi:MAG: NUDIX domain-containing protein [Syntrophomonadaceae bacterium]